MVSLVFWFVLTQDPSAGHPEFTQFDISRSKDEHRVSIAAVLKNPGATEIGESWITVVYFDGDRELRASTPVRLSGLPAQGTTSISLTARQVETFSRYEVVVESPDRKCTYVGTASGSPPRFKAEQAVPARKTERRPTVEVRGLKWFSRDPLEVKQESPADIPFLRIAVCQRGQSIHPTGKAAVMIFDGKKPLRFLNLVLGEECYVRDAGELNSRTALPESIAFDPVSGELWIGLIRVDRSKVQIRLDLTLSLEETGTWEWKDLEKSFAAEPRIADRK